MDLYANTTFMYFADMDVDVDIRFEKRGCQINILADADAVADVFRLLL